MKSKEDIQEELDKTNEEITKLLNSNFKGTPDERFNIEMNLNNGRLKGLRIIREALEWAIKRY